jgi:hypothetical protein
MSEVEYTINLAVRVVGPEAEWDKVAALLAERVGKLSWIRGGFTVTQAEVDEAGDPETERAD